MDDESTRSESSSSTATTHLAREHARSQAGANERFARTIPATAARRVPDGVAASDMLWDETVEGGNYSCRRLPRGARLRLTDPDGDTCVQVLVFNADQTSERLNVADTVKVQWQAYLSAGQLLLSDMGRVLVSFVDDTSAGHDAFGAASNLAWNDKKFGSGQVHGQFPNSRDRMAVAMTKLGLSRRDIGPVVNLFKPMTVDPSGTLVWHHQTPAPGAQVTLRCEMDVLVVLTVTPHVLDPRSDYVVTPLEISAWQGEVTEPDDPIRTSSPEALRAFENTEEWYHGRGAGAELLPVGGAR